MRLVVVESPLAGDVEKNVAYARAAMADCFARGEAPFASHILYPGTLDDLNPADRKLGMTAGFEWAARADARVVYADRGVSFGMAEGIQHAASIGQVIEYRYLGQQWA